MDKPMPDLGFRGMSLFFKLRDLVAPPDRILSGVGLKPGDRVLDYGCGPGGYVRETANLVGESGIVYALDIHPLAVESVRKIAEREGLANVQTICSDCETGLPDDSVDVVLLYDIFHMLSEPEAVLAEMHRVLKPDGVLSFSDHHMRGDDVIAGMTGSQLFKLGWVDGKTYAFVPWQQAQGRN